MIGEFKGEDKLLIINQSGIIKTVTPEVTMHFDNDMIVMEKWEPKKPISVIYFNGEKGLHYVKRFLIEHEGREESFVSEHPNTQIEIVSTDWRPIAEIVFSKERGKERKENIEIDLEAFIAIKGISALGNQLTKDKVNQVNLLEPLAYQAPETDNKDLIITEETRDDASDLDDKGQVTLF